MGNDLIWKIAVGVFLGMAAWTYRADLGTMALYAVGFFIALAVVFFCYQAIANPIKNRLKEQSIKNLVSELLQHELIDSHHEGALCLGLENAFSDEDFNSLSRHLENFKKDLRNGESGAFYKLQIGKISLEIVEEFKLRSNQS